jgi:tetratricopeptide (TPR) repeat protein
MGRHFVSYSSDGSEFARHLRRNLRAGREKIEILTYEDDRLRGEPYQRWIEATIPRCSTLLLVLTERSARSRHCDRELENADRHGLPIFLLVVDDVDPPHIAYDADRFDFTDPDQFRTGLAEVRRSLAELRKPAGVRMLLELRLERVRREADEAKGTRLARLQQQVAGLEEQISQIASAAEDASLAAESGRRKIADHLDRERSARPTGGIQSGVHLVRSLPSMPPDQFLDRMVEREHLEELLRSPRIRLVTVAGRAGVGKTATVCRVLASSSPDGPVATGVAYRSTHAAERVTAAALLRDLAELIPGGSTDLNGLLSNPDLTSLQKLDGILKHLREEPVVLVVDDVDDLLDEGYEISDPELANLLGALLIWRHPVKVVLIGSTAPSDLTLHAATASLNMDRGLPAEDAEAFLRRLDKEEILELHDAAEPQLRRAYQLTDGNPRALELIYAILDADADASLDRVLDTLAENQGTNPAEFLLGELLARLGPQEPMVAVVQALAIYRRPVESVAVDHLLQWRFPGYDSARTLGWLARRRLIREEDHRYFLPARDCDLVMRKIPRGRPDDRNAQPPPFTRFALRHQAANYFEQLKKDDGDIKGIEDLGAHLAEIDLRIQADDYKRAHWLLDTLDFDYLRPWGYSQVLSSYRKQLETKLGNQRLELTNLDALAYAAEECDNPKQALRHYNDALVIAQRLGDPLDLKALRVNLAGAYFKDEQVRRALEEYQLALAIAREHGPPSEEATPLAGICLCLAKMGRFSQAFEYHLQALAIARSADKHSLEAELELNVGAWHGELGRPEEALSHLQRSRQLARELGNRLMEGLCLDAFAHVLVDQGRVGWAVELASRATVIGEQLRSPQLIREGYSTLAFAQLCQGALDDAKHATAAACRYDGGRRSLYALVLQGILSVRAEDCEAAQFAFEDVLARTRAVRADDGDANYAVIDLEGLAVCGLIACGHEELLEDALAAFRAARGLATHPGLVARTLRLLDELHPDDDLPPALLSAREVAGGLGVQPTAIDAER